MAGAVTLPARQQCSCQAHLSLTNTQNRTKQKLFCQKLCRLESLQVSAACPSGNSNMQFGPSPGHVIKRMVFYVEYKLWSSSLRSFLQSPVTSSHIPIVMYVLFCIFCFHRANWHSSATLTEVFPWFFPSCKENARVYLAKTGHGPHSSQCTTATGCQPNYS